ncbi:MAG: reverse transcriptase family protein [Planctomycetota bacterium]
MLKIQRVDHLARRLDIPKSILERVASSSDSFIRELLLTPAEPDAKTRIVVCVCGHLRLIQRRLHDRVLLGSAQPSAFSHGGVRGRHIKSNAAPHTASEHVLTMDISNFYPSIHFRRVYKFFNVNAQCSPDVSRLLTKLTTYKHHLALGLITSPTIANLILNPLDVRLAKACANAGLHYTRYVDDITVSGAYNLDPTKAGIEGFLTSILVKQGFKVSGHKTKYGRLSEGATITNLRVRHGRVDVSRKFLDDLQKIFADVAKVVSGHQVCDTYYSREQIRGKCQFAAWINPERQNAIFANYRRVPWRKYERNCLALNLVKLRPSLSRA